jgi:hypothetical protein
MLYACKYMLLDQQVCFIKPVGLTNQIETHKHINDDPVERVHYNYGYALIWVVNYDEPT